ncbi:MAG: sulfotransferase [Candidatus Hermodarchaeota archaeon]
MSKLKGTKISKILNKKRIYSLIYFEKNHSLDNTILVAGTGRSGTTWLAEILTNFIKYRIIFEPFNPRKVKICKDLLNKQYLPPEVKNDEYFALFNKILAGKIRDLWVNQDNRIFRPQGRIIKTIRASLFLKWLKINFPTIPIIYILRHPCAVVESRLRLNWETIDVDIFLKQENLVKDLLYPFKNILSKAKTQIERNTCIWCVENLVAMNTMEPKDWCVISYENLYQNPEMELKKINDYLAIDTQITNNLFKNNISLTINKDSALLKKKNPIEAWKDKLSEDNINKILGIVEEFSLNTIYDKQFFPKKLF